MTLEHLQALAAAVLHAPGPASLTPSQMRAKAVQVRQTFIEAGASHEDILMFFSHWLCCLASATDTTVAQRRVAMDCVVSGFESMPDRCALTPNSQ